jgi:hypothetical protein
MLTIREDRIRFHFMGMESPKTALTRLMTPTV